MTSQFFDTRHFVDSRLVTDIESVRAMLRAGHLQGDKVNGRFRVARDDAERIASRVRTVRSRLTDLHDRRLLTVDAPEAIADLRLFARFYNGELRTVWTYSDPPIGHGLVSDERLLDELRSIAIVDVSATAAFNSSDVATRSSHAMWIRTSAVPDHARRQGALLMDDSGPRPAMYWPRFIVDQDPDWIRLRSVGWPHLLAAPALGWPPPFDVPATGSLPNGYGTPLPVKADPRFDHAAATSATAPSPTISP